MNPIAFDLETIPAPWADPFDPSSVAVGNLKDPAKISEKVQSEKKKYAETLGLDIYQNMICSFAWADANASGFILLEGSDEKGLILKAWDVLSSNKYDFFVSFNGNNFDVPVLNIHSLFHKVRVPVQISTRKYQVTNHCDLRAILTNWEPYARGNLDFWLKRCLGMEKMEGISGGMVADAWDMGMYEKVGEYNKDDAEKTFKLFQHVQEYLPVIPLK